MIYRGTFLTRGVLAAVLTTLLAQAGQADIISGLEAHWKLDETGVTPPVVDSTGNFPDGSNNGAITGVPGMFGTAYDFDGMDDKLTLADSSLDPAGDFSIFMWIKSDAIHNETGGHYLLNNYTTDKPPGRFGGQVSSGYFGWFKAPGSITSAAYVNDGQWHLVGLTRTGTVLNFDHKMWVDAVDVTNDNDPVFRVGGDGKDWLLGGRVDDNNRQYLGSIDDVRVYSRALSQEDIQQLVPEPSTFALLVLGAAWFGFRWRRRFARMKAAHR